MASIYAFVFYLILIDIHLARTEPQDPRSNFQSQDPRSNFQSQDPRSNFQSQDPRSNFQSQDPRSNFQPHFKPSYIKYNELLQEIPDDTVTINAPVHHPFPVRTPTHPKPIASHDILFRFSNVGLRRICQDFINSHDVISLSLDNNEINEISPFAFRGMRNLRHLNLSGNQIPRRKLLSLANVPRLQTLILNNNIPVDDSSGALKEYEMFESLEHLHLCHGQLGDFQVPFHLATPGLTHLHLSNNSISSNAIFDNIPASLTHLYLEDNNIVHVEQDKLRYVQELIMDQNNFTQICFDQCQDTSISLRGAVRIQNLTLSRNLIAEITTDAFSDTKHLVNLDLSGNKLADVAKGIFNHTVLISSLSIADNALATIPDVCPLVYLKRLNLTGNRISAVLSGVFCQLRNLEYLYLANNKISVVETWAFINLPSLKHLDLSGNRLRQLPGQWLSLRYLQELHLERNNFTRLDDVSLVNIKTLRNVHLDMNPMPYLKVSSFQSLSPDLTIHVKSMYVEEKCKECKCDDDEEDNDEDDDDNGD